MRLHGLFSLLNGFTPILHSPSLILHSDFYNAVVVEMENIETP